MEEWKEEDEEETTIGDILEAFSSFPFQTLAPLFRSNNFQTLEKPCPFLFILLLTSKQV